MTDGSTNNASRARELLKKTIACDLHSCPTYDPLSPSIADLRRYQDAGVKCVHVNVGDSDMTLQQQIALIAAFRHFVKQHGDQYLLASGVADVERAATEGKLAVCFDLEGAQAFGEDLALIQLFYDLGVRWMLLVYNRCNQVGGGCHDAVDEGLTEFGRAFVAEMDRVGMIKCCSHTGYRTARDVLEMTQVPTIFSHSNARALCDHPRNIPDDLMRACAATGGVVGVNGIGIFLCDATASTAAIVRHIDYIAQLIGPEHVAIGLDSVFDMPNMTTRLAAAPQTWPRSAGYGGVNKIAQPEQWPDLVESLLALGYAEADVLGIIGGNFLRVAKAVWK
jgi:membrane dipeptidase